MAKVYLLCGKICSGKSRYAKRLAKERNAVILSCDELMLALFDPLLGDSHDAISEKAQLYLLNRTYDILAAGTSVILDWGFWQLWRRRAIEAALGERGAAFEWHYIHVADAVWRRNIAERNSAVLSGTAQDSYFVDEGLLNKLDSLFEEPDRSEMNVWYENTRQDA